MHKLKDELLLISELMGELMEKMEPSESDFDERLGRGKVEPVVETTIIEARPIEDLEEDAAEHWTDEDESAHTDRIEDFISDDYDDETDEYEEEYSDEEEEIPVATSVEIDIEPDVDEDDIFERLRRIRSK